MAINLRSELRKALSTDIAELDGADTDPRASRRNVIRLGLLRNAKALVERRRDVFPEIERIAVALWRYGNGDLDDLAGLAPSTRRVMLVEAAKTYIIVHGTD